jgi:hypothetical protein
MMMTMMIVAWLLWWSSSYISSNILLFIYRKQKSDEKEGRDDDVRAILILIIIIMSHMQGNPILFPPACLQIRIHDEEVKLKFSLKAFSFQPFRSFLLLYWSRYGLCGGYGII